MIGESITYYGLQNFLQKIAKLETPISRNIKYPPLVDPAKPLNPESFRHLPTTAKPSMQPHVPKVTTANLRKPPGNITRMSDFVARQYIERPQVMRGIEEAIQDLPMSPMILHAATPGQALAGAAASVAAGGASGAMQAAKSPKLQSLGTALRMLTKLSAPRRPHLRIGSGI